MDSAENLRAKRDRKAKPHLEQYAPVWLTEETIAEEDETIRFHIIFHHNRYGWVTRRYLYDGFNNVLYHKGQTTIDEDEAVEIQAEEPYINPTIADIPNAYGG